MKTVLCLVLGLSFVNAALAGECPAVREGVKYSVDVTISGKLKFDLKTKDGKFIGRATEKMCKENYCFDTTDCNGKKIGLLLEGATSMNSHYAGYVIKDASYKEIGTGTMSDQVSKLMQVREPSLSADGENLAGIKENALKIYDQRGAIDVRNLSLLTAVKSFRDAQADQKANEEEKEATNPNHLGVDGHAPKSPLPPGFSFGKDIEIKISGLKNIDQNVAAPVAAKSTNNQDKHLKSSAPAGGSSEGSDAAKAGAAGP
ncbi:MAG: hypothetical protein ACXWPM_12755 [Bdellovibrionota bacterium]